MANTDLSNQNDRTSPSNLPPVTNSDEKLVVKPNPESYGTGHTQGRVVERQHYEADQQVRDETNIANGLLIGILLTGLVLGGSALAYFLNQDNRVPETQPTIIVPEASPSSAPSPQVKERVIERVVPVPQPQQVPPTVVPAPNVQVPAPNIQINIPKSQQPAPQAQPITPKAEPITPKAESITPKTEPSAPSNQQSDSSNTDTSN